MSEWNDRIKTNTVWQVLELFDVAIDQALTREAIDAQAADSLERLRAVLTFCGKRLASADPYLLEPASLNKISAAFTVAKTEIEAFVSDGASPHLVAANREVDAALVSLASILVPITTEDLSTIGESAAAYRTTLQKYLDDAASTNKVVKKSATENLQKLTEFSTVIASERQKIDTALADFQSQFTIGQTTRTAEFAAAQADRQATNAASISQFEKSFSENQADRQNKFSAALAENQAQFSAAQEIRAKAENDAQTLRQADFSGLMIDYAQKLSEQNTQFTSQMQSADRQAKEALSELKESYQKSAQNILDEITTQKERVEKLVGVIGNLGVTSGYLLVANHARKALYLWQFLTVSALGGLIYVAYVIAFNPHAENGDFVQGLATRIFLSVAVGVFAAYAASQADKSSTVERKNRKLALELEAVGPYIAPLPQDMQNKFRADLGERSFGVPEGDSKRSTEGAASPANMVDVLKSKELRETIEEAVSKAIKASGVK